jgi:hypothetical protein
METVGFTEAVGFTGGTGQVAGGALQHGHITGAPGVTPTMVIRTMRVTPTIVVRTIRFPGVR